MDNYFNYFTEIEEHFQKRRGTILLLSTLDWALIETWKEAGIPLAAVLRGIDDAFDKYDARPSKTRKVNSLAYCAQAVLSAAEDMREAAVGTPREKKDEGLAGDEVAGYLERCAIALHESSPPAAAKTLVEATRDSLREMADGLRGVAQRPPLEELERRLTVMEEKLFAVLLGSSSDDLLVRIRADADRELAPYRNKMSAPQIEQLLRQYTHKRLLEQYSLPRLSLFYMQ